MLDMSEYTDPNSGEKSRHFLVKWRSLSYEDCTWELEDDVDKPKIASFLKYREPPPKEQRTVSGRGHGEWTGSRWVDSVAVGGRSGGGWMWWWWEDRVTVGRSHWVDVMAVWTSVSRWMDGIMVGGR